MAISTSNIAAGANTIYTSSGDSALTFMSFCNHSGAAVSIDVNIVPNGDIASVNNLFASGLEIDPGDTFILYEGGEKILLSNGDTVVVTPTTANAISAITSYIGL